MICFGEELDYALADAAVGACDNDGEIFGHVSSEAAFVIDVEGCGDFFEFIKRSLYIVRLVGVVMSTHMNDVTSSLAFIDDL